MNLKKKISIILINLYAFPILFLWTTISILFAPLAFILILMLTKKNKEESARALVWLYGRGFLFFFSLFIKFKKNDLSILERGAYIIVLNHYSFFDTYCMAMLPHSNIVFVVRDWPFKIFFYRPFMRLSDYINSEKDDIEEKVKAKIKSNASVLFFPEGHRSRSNKVNEFYSGAFRVAVKNKMSILPICIYGTNHFFPPSRFYFKPTTIELKALPPVSYKDFQKKHGHFAMKYFVRNEIVNWIKGKVFEDMENWVKVDKLLFHKKPILLIDSIKKTKKKDEALIKTKFDKDSMFASENGFLERSILVELIAQSFAAFEGYQGSLERRQPSMGFLVNIAKFEVFKDAILPIRLYIKIKAIDKIGDITIAEGSIFNEQKIIIAKAQIKLWITNQKI